jgi:uncharacterized phage protein (TIGR01671 family)
MRPIKFRAWDKKGKEMIPFDEPWLCQEYGSLAWRSSKYNGIGALPGSYAYLNDDFDEEEEKPYELMQFTGLADKNGKEIYEGDVVEFTDQNGRVVNEVGYVDALGAYVLIDHKTNKADFIPTVGEDALEVIGNIYENPELVKL